MDHTITTLDTQVCSKCNGVLPLTEFKIRPSGRNGRRRICKRCLSPLSAEEYDIKQSVIQFVLDLRELGLKVCGQCQEIKPLDAFHAENRKSTDGKGRRCKECVALNRFIRVNERRSEGRAAKTALIVTEKICISCERTLPLSAFTINNNNRDGYQNKCGECIGRLPPEEYAQFIADRQRDVDLLALGMKHCRMCGQDKPLDGFARRPDSRDGRQYKCRECGAISDRACRNIEKERARRHANPEYHRDYQRKRYSQKRNPNGRVELVKRLIVAERDGWICQHCNQPIDPNAPYKLEPGKLNPEYLNIDHWVPLSRGGDHTYENCYASHAICNWRKNAKVLTEPPPLLRTA